MSCCPATSSGLLSADAAVATKSAKIHSVILIGGSDAATVTVYDNPSAASGTVLVKLACAAGASEVYHAPVGIVVNNGIYVDVSGTGVGAVVHYELSA